MLGLPTGTGEDVDQGDARCERSVVLRDDVT
jgi:hypothetical protein